MRHDHGRPDLSLCLFNGGSWNQAWSYPCPGRRLSKTLARAERIFIPLRCVICARLGDHASNPPRLGSTFLKRTATRSPFSILLLYLPGLAALLSGVCPYLVPNLALIVPTMAARQSFLRIARTSASPGSAQVPRSSLRNLTTARFVSSSSGRRNKDDPYHKASTAATGTSAGPHEGSQSRTDNQISIEYPDDGRLPREPPLQGRGG